MNYSHGRLTTAVTDRAWFKRTKIAKTADVQPPEDHLSWGQGSNMFVTE